MKRRPSETRRLSRRDFLKVGGTGLPGTALLGSGTLTGCGGSEQGGGATKIYFTFAPDESGTTEKLISKFNRENKGKYGVVFRQGNADTGQRFDKLRTELQPAGRTSTSSSGTSSGPPSSRRTVGSPTSPTASPKASAESFCRAPWRP